MTKLLWCLECGDMVLPIKELEPRFCYCKRHAIWWTNAIAGNVDVYDKEKHKCGTPDICGWTPKCRILGLHNDFMRMIIDTDGKTYKDKWKEILADTPDYYLFKDWETPLVGFYVGHIDGVNWSDELP